MKNITIKKSEFKKLYDIACEAWKPKLKEKLKDFIFDENITFTKEFFNSMQEACTKDQLIVFNEIFKEYIKDASEVFKVKTYSEVCKQLKETELKASDFDFLPTLDDSKKALSFAKIKQLERFFNQGWVPNWNDNSEYKYYLWYQYKSSGWEFGSVGSCYGSFGLPGFYKTGDIANHVQKYFNDIYLDIL